jgi:hypothetical protein
MGINNQTLDIMAAFTQEPPELDFIQRAVKPRPSGRGYKAHLDWNFCLQFGER